MVSQEDSSQVYIRKSWLIPAARSSVYAIASDFEKFPQYFPGIAYSLSILERNGNYLSMEVRVPSFGPIFPKVFITINAELLPNQGYKAQTHNRTFNTRGDELLLLEDAEGGTRINYTYTVTLKHKWQRPLYSGLLKAFGLGYWERSYLKPLTTLARQHQSAA